jgi:hypothetical protein
MIFRFSVCRVTSKIITILNPSDFNALRNPCLGGRPRSRCLTEFLDFPHLGLCLYADPHSAGNLNVGIYLTGQTKQFRTFGDRHHHLNNAPQVNIPVGGLFFF